jgi:hypothetical protein
LQKRSAGTTKKNPARLSRNKQQPKKGGGRAPTREKENKKRTFPACFFLFVAGVPTGQFLVDVPVGQ